MIRPRIKAAPRTDPTTMPAIWPPDRPFLEVAADLGVAVGEPVDVGSESGGMDVVLGRRTFTHRCSTFEFTQHESVEFAELVAQKAQSPCKLESYPQSLGSFSCAPMQDGFSDSGGREHTVKSDLILLIALGPVVPHNSGLDDISCSLIAY